SILCDQLFKKSKKCLLQGYNLCLVECAFFREFVHCHQRVVAGPVAREKLAASVPLSRRKLFFTIVTVGTTVGGSKQHLKERTVVVEHMDIWRLRRNITEEDASFPVVFSQIAGIKQADIIAGKVNETPKIVIDVVLDGPLPADIDQGHAIF